MIIFRCSALSIIPTVSKFLAKKHLFKYQAYFHDFKVVSALFPSLSLCFVCQRFHTSVKKILTEHVRTIESQFFNQLMY